MTAKPNPKRRQRRHTPDSGDKFQQHRDIEAWFPHLTPRALKVWLVLWNIQPTAGVEFFVSHSKVGKRVSIDRANAIRMIGELKQRGVLEQLSTGNSRGYANTYRIPVPLPKPHAVNSETAVSPVTLEG